MTEACDGIPRKVFLSWLNYFLLAAQLSTVEMGAIVFAIGKPASNAVRMSHVKTVQPCL